MTVSGVSAVGSAAEAMPEWSVRGPLAAWLNPEGQPLEAERVGQFLRSMSCREDPVHLNSIARALGVQRIAVTDKLDCPGQVHWGQDGPTIWLMEGLRNSRRRFTLAHELAHVVLGHGRQAPGPNLAGRQTLRAEERFADLIASATLIPERNIMSLRALDVVTLDDVRGVASHHEVSLSAVVTRLGVRSRPAFLLGLRERDEEWITAYFVGRVKGLPTTLQVPPDQSGKLLSLGGEDAPVHLRVTMNGHQYQLDGTGNRRGPMVLMLVNRVRYDDGSEAVQQA
jgi:hypothetical protein